MKDSVTLLNFIEGINGELDDILHECNTHHCAVLKEKIRQRMIKEGVNYTTQQQYMEDNVGLDRLVAKMFITEGTWQFAGPLDDDSNYPPYMQELVLQETALRILGIMQKTQEAKFLQTSSLEVNTINNNSNSNINNTTITSKENKGCQRQKSFRITSVACVGYAYGGLSSSYCPSLEEVMASSPTVWGAFAEEERICMGSCSSCGVRDMQLVSRGAWRVQGGGVQRMFALLPTP
ncbi:hypothetical protein LSM04_000748 [Trypanosoma melophagium]|uniref:uncharacterized protein n=1 Tax=Trypanosoma melophagium TaxID=715481 RepID=UPI00351A9D58|nr:hypothetical protein LSM04_000748 [Trypanosoma melophagium]